MTYFCFLKNKVDACVETVSIGLATEPDQLGPCEPVCRHHRRRLISINPISFISFSLGYQRCLRRHCLE